MWITLLLALAQAPVADAAPKPIPAVANDLPRGFGYAVELCGDLDGDGRSEFAIGGRGWPSVPTAILIYGGINGEVFRRIVSGSPSEFIRGSMVRTGDLDGDHVDDLAVSIGSASGRVEIHSGKSGAVVRTFSPIEGEVDFGIGLCRLGDVDSDGINDLVITASLGMPTARLGDAVEGADDYAVRWVVVSGATGRRLRTVEWKGASDRYRHFSRENPNAIVIGDVNADGTVDFAVVDQRCVRVESGAKCATLLSIPVAPQAGNEDYRITVLGVPDADGDGRPDILVSTPLAIPQDGAKTATYLRFHSSTTGKLIRSIDQSIDQSGYGFALCAAPTKSADGSTEFWLTRHDWLGTYLMRASLINSEDGVVLRDYGIDDFGYTLASGADVNGDGITDVIAGEYSQYTGDGSSCGGYVYSGKDGKLLWERVRDPIKAAKNREWLSK